MQTKDKLLTALRSLELKRYESSKCSKLSVRLTFLQANKAETHSAVDSCVWHQAAAEQTHKVCRDQMQRATMLLLLLYAHKTHTHEPCCSSTNLVHVLGQTDATVSRHCNKLTNKNKWQLETWQMGQNNRQQEQKRLLKMRNTQIITNYFSSYSCLSGYSMTNAIPTDSVSTDFIPTDGIPTNASSTEIHLNGPYGTQRLSELRQPSDWWPRP